MNTDIYLIKQACEEFVEKCAKKATPAWKRELFPEATSRLPMTPLNRPNEDNIRRVQGAIDNAQSNVAVYINPFPPNFNEKGGEMQYLRKKRQWLLEDQKKHQAAAPKIEARAHIGNLGGSPKKYQDELDRFRETGSKIESDLQQNKNDQLRLARYPSGHLRKNPEINPMILGPVKQACEEFVEKCAKRKIIKELTKKLQDINPNANLVNEPAPSVFGRRNVIGVPEVNRGLRSDNIYYLKKDLFDKMTPVTVDPLITVHQKNINKLMAKRKHQAAMKKADMLPRSSSADIYYDRLADYNESVADISDRIRRFGSI